MSGIIFFRTQNLKDCVSFYTKKLGMEIWLDQEACIILEKGNLLLGFCQADEPETSGMITFFYETKEEVDKIFLQFKQESITEPEENEKFRIYQFFAKDPEGRVLEFQSFLHPIKWTFEK